MTSYHIDCPTCDRTKESLFGIRQDSKKVRSQIRRLYSTARGRSYSTTERVARLTELEYTLNNLHAMAANDRARQADHMREGRKS